MYYSRVDIILFSTGLYKSAFLLILLPFAKTRFQSSCVLVFHVFLSLVFSFSVLCFGFNIISKERKIGFYVKTITHYFNMWLAISK